MLLMQSIELKWISLNPTLTLGDKFNIFLTVMLSY